MTSKKLLIEDRTDCDQIYGTDYRSQSEREYYLEVCNTPEAVKAMKAHVAAATIKVVKPGPNFPGVEGPTSVLMLPFLLMSSTKTPDDVVYKVVKAIHGNKKNLVAALGAFRAFDPKEMNLDIGLKVHSGALKFYKEAGI